MYHIIYPIKFPISYGVFFLFLLYISPQYKLVYLFYPYVFLCSSIGGSFCIYFLVKINKFIQFQNVYSDPFLALLYPNHHQLLFYRIHLCLMILMKFLLIRYWPFSFKFESLMVSSFYFVVMYI